MDAYSIDTFFFHPLNEPLTWNAQSRMRAGFLHVSQLQRGRPHTLAHRRETPTHTVAHVGHSRDYSHCSRMRCPARAKLPQVVAGACWSLCELSASGLSPPLAARYGEATGELTCSGNVPHVCLPVVGERSITVNKQGRKIQRTL